MNENKPVKTYSQFIKNIESSISLTKKLISSINKSQYVATLISEYHERYENYTLVQQSPAYRTIDILFNGDSIVISIDPTLKPKRAKLFIETPLQATYAGEDPDFTFTIFLNNKKQIEKVSLLRNDLKLELSFYTRMPTIGETIIRTTAPFYE